MAVHDHPHRLREFRFPSLLRLDGVGQGAEAAVGRRRRGIPVVGSGSTIATLGVHA
ncbi:hypothetical protein [Streptomyces prasinus]|uniref:hypothetical protein n=1 Tax=Streptomyces prasinus TaxID=67345 RepID=UPI0033F67036